MRGARVMGRGGGRSVQAPASALDGGHAGTLGGVGRFGLYRAGMMRRAARAALLKQTGPPLRPCQMVRSHGMLRGHDARAFVANLRMPGIAAGTGRAQLARLPRFVGARRRSAEMCSGPFAGTSVRPRPAAPSRAAASAAPRLRWPLPPPPIPACAARTSYIARPVAPSMDGGADTGGEGDGNNGAALRRSHGKVSIVVPSLNAAAYIGECIDSALAQTYGDTEIVVVDAGSTDGTLDVLRRYGGRIRVMHDEGGNISHSMNEAIGAARGEWVRRVDADDVMHPESIEALAAASDPDDPGSTIPHADYSRIDGSGRDTGVSYRFHYNHLSAFEQGVRQIDHIFGSTTMCLIHRSVFERAGPFDEGFDVAEDREFAMRCLLLHGIRFVNVPRVLYGYRVRGGQLTGDRQRMRSEADRAVQHVLSRLPGAERARYERAAREHGRLHGFMLGVWSYANASDEPAGEALGGGGGEPRTTYASLMDGAERERGRRWAADNGAHPLVAACAGAGFGECHRMGSGAWLALEGALRAGGLGDGAGALE